VKLSQIAVVLQLDRHGEERELAFRRVIARASLETCEGIPEVGCA
jgi:hypothetical protein